MTYSEADLLVGKFIEDIKKKGGVQGAGAYAYTTGFLASWITSRVAENPKLAENLKVS